MRSAIAHLFYSVSSICLVLAILFDSDAVQVWSKAKNAALKQELTKYVK